MRTRMSGLTGRVLSRVLIGFIGLAGATAAASAQTTVTINQPLTQVVSATIRGGTYADKNDQSLLATRSADNLEDNRRAMLKFDTQNTIPAGTAVTSAVMTVTVKSGAADASRRIAAYQVTTSWAETEVTWNQRRASEKWVTPGGDLGSKVSEAVVSNVAGSKVSFDVTSLVKLAVAGKLGSSRYTRIVLIDLDESTADSYREYMTPADATVTNRPVLKVTYGTATSTSDPPPTTTSTSTLRVLQWNTHHGGIGTDGVYDPDRLIKTAASFKPDVVSFNEVEHYSVDQPALFASLMKKYTGVTWYYRYTSGTGTQSGIGNLIMSRIPFDATAIQPLSYTRAAVDATIHVNGRIINVSSTHLDAASTSYRLKEIGELTTWERSLAEQRIICGDFNAWPGSTENATMTTAYYDSWAKAQANGTAIAYPGNTAGNTRNSRIDYIYYSHGASSLVLQSSQVFDTRDANGVMPSDHRPLMSIFTVK
jgi:endonuclease/exonuclease/phosphatase family metal-dependent hydrolase